VIAGDGNLPACRPIYRAVRLEIATVTGGRPVSRAAIISIVDDDKSVREAMSSLVRSLGYQACEFDSAEAFLASPRLQETSCLIADVQMPGMSGLELQDVLLARHQGLPIIFISAFPADRIRKRAEAAGAAGFFSKPVDSQMIIRCLDAALSRSGL
jgi:FixJ family two-component response regulator